MLRRTRKLNKKRSEWTGKQQRLPQLLKKLDWMIWQKRSCKLRPKLKSYTSRRKRRKRYVLRKRKKMLRLQLSKKDCALKRRKKI